MLQKVPGLPPEAVRSALQQGATDIETPGFDSLAGAGLLNAAASVALVHLVTTTTSSTAATTSTTSTTVGNASCAEPCAEDGDACTSEQCEPGSGCRSIPVERAQGVVCLVDGVLRARECDRSQISARVARVIGRKALKARAHASRSIGAPPAKYGRHVARTLAILRQLTRKVESAIAAGRLVGSCQKQVTDALTRTRALAESTTF
jgi:hypothetical protein